MPRSSRSSSRDLAMDEGEEVTTRRRNPRRSGASMDTEPMDVDDSEPQGSEGDPMSSSDDGDSDQDDLRTMKIKRRTRGTRNRSNSNAKKSSKESGSARRSSRSTRFTGGMREPVSDSVQDLFRGTAMASKVTSTKKSSRTVVDSSSDEEEEEDYEESPRRPRKRPSRRGQEAKSPARRHARARKTVRDETSDEESSEDEVLSSSDEEEDEDEMKIQRILASRSETRQRWKEIGATMNSSEVTDGSRWIQDSTSKHDSDKDDDALQVIEERFLVKWSKLSYLHCSWETQEDLFEQVDSAKTYLTTFFRKSVHGVLFTADERKDGDYFDPAFCQVDRIMDVFFDDGDGNTKRIPHNKEEEAAAKPSDFGIILDKNDPDFENGTGRQFLVKWQCRNYSECSYEFERDLMLADVDFSESLNDYYERSHKPTKTELKKRVKTAEEAKRRCYKIFGDKTDLEQDKREADVKEYQSNLAEHVFLNGGQLRDYQAEGVTWFLSNYVNNRSCILADEMGLGKTLQTAAFINLIVEKMHRPGPFLIIVPLSTMSHWQREFAGWTGLNTIVYHGTAEDRKWIREFEFAFPADRPDSVGANALYLNKCAGHKTKGPWMTKVVVTTPEMLVADDWAELAAVQWEVLVVDEAHRLKNHNSKLAVNLRKNQFSFKHKILLTGTPIQNDIKEFWTLLNFIDPDSFDDEDSFLEKYGDIKSKEHIDELHETIRPYILRRLKEDVEKSVPPKEETLIEVELTVQQKQYYRALYEKNVQFLHKNKKRALDGPSLNNLAMQLRKCCNHLYLLNGVEEELRGQQKEDMSEADFLAKGSGKLVLLDKLLPRLKQNGHRILIFSQFKIMLDILEDYLLARKMKFERIDGSITGHKRTMAIDRFQDPDSKDPPFVMLLSTRAGGVGINLTSADTCIIFDSDWNPQNDLQAQARCHRIGQTKKVKVYRLLSRKSYEMQMFHMSSLKMGLDQAVLKGFESGASGEGAMTKEEVERLLRHGAYDIFNEDKAGTAEAESNDFIEQDIDSILERRSRTVVHDNTGSKSNAAGGTFSKASFTAPKTPSDKKDHQQEDIDIEDPEFWKKMVGEALPQVESELKPRKRKTANYSESFYNRQLDSMIRDPNTNESGSSDSESASSASSDDEDEDNAPERARWGGHKPQHWRRLQGEALLKGLERYGYGLIPWGDFQKKLPDICHRFMVNDIHRMSWSIVLMSFCEVARDDAVSTQKRAQRQADRKREAEGGILADSGPVEASLEMIESSFQKLWTANSIWAQNALSDAVNFARSSIPRSTEAMGASKEDEITTLFYSSLWPALSGRGWREEANPSNPKGKLFIFGKYRFDSPNIVMNEAVRIHPELSNMVIPLLNTLQESRLRDSRKDEDDRNRDLAITSNNVSHHMLGEFLLRYSPLQLISDRSSSRRLPISRRLINSCYYTFGACTIVKKAGENDLEDKKLLELLCVDGRSALPHPLWTPNHDATLIRAIAKHGWIDRDKACRAVTSDHDIKWGFPFELTDKAKEINLGEDELVGLRATANRAASFVEIHSALADALKGCNRHLVIESYGLKHYVKDESTEEVAWKVDEELLMASTSNSGKNGAREATDLPVKKDMAKRAKTVIQKTTAVLVGGTRPSGAKTVGEPSHQVVDYGLAILDQGDRCCVLLAEMVRGIVRGSHTKMAKQVRMLCALAHEEAIELRKMYESSHRNEKAVEMQKIANQIALAKRSLKSSAVPGKNILRVMLGLEPVAPQNNKAMFPSAESLEDQSEKPKSLGRKEGARRDDGALGERAIVRALKKALDKSDGSPCHFKPSDETGTGLQLTMIEILILSAFCSEGIPSPIDKPSKTSANDVTWEIIGTVLSHGARDYFNETKEKLAKCRASLEKLEGHSDVDALNKAAKKVAIAEYEVSLKEEAAQHAADYASSPEKLAKKSIMLMEKVRRFGFSNFHAQAKNAHKFENGIGPKVPAWLGKEISRLAAKFDILDGTGKPMSFTTTDLMAHNPEFGDTRVAAYLDKKSCRQVVSQISLLARLSSLFSRYSEDEMRERLGQAMKNSKKLEDVWDKRPIWWNDSAIDHSYLLLKGLYEHGFPAVLSETKGFQADGENQSLRSLGLTKAIVQQRVNQLVRELHTVEEAEDMLRMLQERRNRSATKKQGYDRSLAECHTKTSSSKKSSLKRGAIQTGLHAFFSSTKSIAKKDKVIVLSDAEDSPSSSSTAAGKRKESPVPMDEDSPSGKKTKGEDFFAVVPGKAAGRTPEKRLRTIVNEDGVIELVSVPK